MLKTYLAIALLDRLTAVADGEVAADGDGASRYVVVVCERNGLNVREVGGVENDQRVRRTKHRSAAGNDDAIRFLTNGHAERLYVQLSLLKLTTSIDNK